MKYLLKTFHFPCWGLKIYLGRPTQTTVFIMAVYFHHVGNLPEGILMNCCWRDWVGKGNEL